MNGYGIIDWCTSTHFLSSKPTHPKPNIETEQITDAPFRGRFEVCVELKKTLEFQEIVQLKPIESSAENFQNKIS